MVNIPSLRRWSSMQGMPVISLDTTNTVGIIDDFYFEPDTNAVRAFRLKRGILGYASVPANYINTIERDRVTVLNQQAVINEDHDRRLSQLPLGHDLYLYIVKSESGDSLGKVGNILFETQPPIALHVAAYEILDLSGRGRIRLLNAEEVSVYQDNTIYVMDNAAKALR